MDGLGAGMPGCGTGGAQGVSPEASAASEPPGTGQPLAAGAEESRPKAPPPPAPTPPPAGPPKAPPPKAKPPQHELHPPHPARPALEDGTPHPPGLSSQNGLRPERAKTRSPSQPQPVRRLRTEPRHPPRRNPAQAPPGNSQDPQPRPTSARPAFEDGTLRPPRAETQAQAPPGPSQDPQPRPPLRDWSR